MKNVFSNFFELHVNLCMHTYDLKDYLKTVGIKLKDKTFFIVTEDGNCWIIDPKDFDGSLDEKKYSADGKIKELPNVDYYGLTKINIPNGVTSIRREAFYCCRELTGVTLPNSVTSIGWDAFRYCSDLTSVVIPNSVTSIESGAFSECSNLTSMIIPDGVTSIESYAFECCIGLLSVTISAGVTSINDCAFAWCSSLTSMTIPDNVKHVRRSAFLGCANLKDITFKGKTLDEVKAMEYYPWGIEDELVIKVA